MEVEASSSNYKKHEKIEKVLQKFLQPNFKISNDVYLNLFLTHLVDKNNHAQIWQTNEEQFCQWIIEASNLWDQLKVNPQASILSFALNLASQLSANEQIFVKLNCKNVYESLVGVSQTNSIKEPTVTLGLVTLLCSFLEHTSGLQWVMLTTYWTDVIDLGLKAHTMYIRKKAYQFVIKLLEKSMGLNRNFAVNLVELLVKPMKELLQSLPCDKNAKPKEIESRELFEALKPSLDLILEIVETMVKNFNREVIQLFLEQETSETMEKFLLLSQSEDFSFELLRIQFVFRLYHMVRKVEGKKVVAYDALSLFDCKLMLNLIRAEVVKHNVRCVVKICDYAHGLFCCLAPRMPKIIKEKNTIEFQVQVMFLQIVPIYSFSMQMRCQGDITYLMMNDIFRNDFFHKWLKMSAVQNIEIWFKWMESLKMKANLVDDVVFCLHYVVKMKRLLNKERAAIIFSALVYSLMDCMEALKEKPETELSSSYKYFLYLKTLVETIVDFMESFDLKWKDTIETTCGLVLSYDFLLYPHWTDNTMTLAGLKLLNTAIAKCMSPDLALLIYNTDDFKVSATGSLLYAKCHDIAWEIRDSALEVVYTLSLNANTSSDQPFDLAMFGLEIFQHKVFLPSKSWTALHHKLNAYQHILQFPAYTEILLNAELPQLVVNMALKDGECFVRATAFKCLQELIQIPEIWKIVSNIHTFLGDMLDVFKNETEGIVRKEVAVLIYKIDKFQNFPEEIMPRVYDVMTHAAIADLHWEVKFNALDFWFNLWEQHLIHQGMIDQMFPSHTFSKEHKKIVALNEAEVRKRIIKVLNQLSHVGCLHVMKCAVQDDCDVEVSKKATDFTFNTLKMLKIYKVHCENVDLSEQPSSSILQKSFPNQPFNVPISPARSFPSPPSIENLGSPQFGSTWFDPLTPLPVPFSPCLDLNILMPTVLPISTAESSPQENRTSPHGCSVDQQELPFHNDISSRRQSDSFSDTLLSPLTSNLNGMDEEGSFDSDQLENFVCFNSRDPIHRELMMDEVLNSNDIILLQGLYNHTDQVTNNCFQMKTKAYMAPSQYLKFVYTELESIATENTQWLNSLDEFDSLLDDILKEYNIVADINNMDCY